MINPVSCIRLNTGEVLLAFITKKFWNGDVQVTEPNIVLTVAEGGQMEVNFAPWIPYAKDETFRLRKESIQTIFEPRPALATNYKRVTGNTDELSNALKGGQVRGQVR